MHQSEIGYLHTFYKTLKIKIVGIAQCIKFCFLAGGKCNPNQVHSILLRDKPKTSKLLIILF